MIKKTTTFVLVCLFVSISIRAQSTMQYRGFSGGMALHSGYVQSKPFHIKTIEGVDLSQQIRGATLGIGGSMRFHFGNHLRVGMEGYGSTVEYGEYKSFSTIGWGGVLLDYAFPIKRYTPYIGITFGGGSVENLIIPDANDSDFLAEKCTLLRRYGFIAVTPFIGCEFTITDHMRINLKLDYIFNVSNKQLDFPYGIRFYIGFAFFRLKT